MTEKSLGRTFFERNSFVVAEELIGCFLCRRFSDETIIRHTISELEVYDGFEDRASHAFKGPTKRNRVMFGSAGRLYIYLCYGMHWMLNITTEREDYPAAILIRALANCSGPGRLTKMLSINGHYNNKSLGRQTGLWIETRQIQNPSVKRSPRIGIAYAGNIWAKKPYRFTLDSIS